VAAKRVQTKQVRRSVTLSSEVAKVVDRIAKKRRLSDNRVLLELIEQGIEARAQKEKAFSNSLTASGRPAIRNR
jgi:predicted transcriptional regulator